MKENEASELRALSSVGWSMNDIAMILDLPLNTVKKELSLSEKEIGQSLLDENKINQRYSIDEHLPQKYEQFINEIRYIIRELRSTAAKTYDLKEKRKASALIKKCESMAADLFDENKSTTATETTIDDALRFVSDYKKNTEIEI